MLIGETRFIRKHDYLCEETGAISFMIVSWHPPRGGWESYLKDIGGFDELVKSTQVLLKKGDCYTPSQEMIDYLAEYCESQKHDGYWYPVWNGNSRDERDEIFRKLSNKEMSYLDLGNRDYFGEFLEIRILLDPPNPITDVQPIYSHTDLFE